MNLLIFQALAIIPVFAAIHMANSLLLQVKKDLRPPDREDNRCSTLPAWSEAINHSSAANEWDLLSGAWKGKKKKNRNTSYLIKKKSTDWQ